LLLLLLLLPFFLLTDNPTELSLSIFVSILSLFFEGRFSSTKKGTCVVEEEEGSKDKKLKELGLDFVIPPPQLLQKHPALQSKPT
jgi:hypothetical protein